MNKMIFLSHELNQKTPGYGGNSGFSSKNLKSMNCGDSCNQMEWIINNHIGTHIDAPKHFSKNGKSITDYPASFWTFNQIALINVKINEGELIYPENNLIEKIPTNCDFLILKTGFENFRDEEKYWSSNPGCSPELGTWLRNNRPNIRLIGFDFISLTSYKHRPVGRVAHDAFLNPDHDGEPILIVEDMKLSELKDHPAEVTILPFLVSQADGSPVTVLAKV